MPQQPSAANPSKYRRFRFVGGRILQARELNLLQDIERYVPGLSQTRLAKRELEAMFRDGALLNVNVTTSGPTVTLAPADPSLPMLVFVAGAFEEFSSSPMTFTLTPRAAGLKDYIYLNWVLWRVTADGADGTLVDSAFRDASTGEPTAEVGQLEVSLSTTSDHGTVGSDPRILGRNPGQIPVCELEWTSSGTLVVNFVTRFTPLLEATQQASGMVRLSTPGAPVAVGTSDPRLSDQRVPVDASVTDPKVGPLQFSQTQGSVNYTDETNTTVTEAIQTVSGGGVSSDKIKYSTWSSSLTEALDKILGRISRIFSVLRSHNSRIQALENAPGVDLNFHVGKNLGLQSSHPPVIDRNAGSGPFEAVTNGQESNYAFLARSGSVQLGAITGNGDFRLLDPVLAPAPETVNNELLDFSRFSAVARKLLDHLKNHPTGGGQTITSLSGDVTGSPGSNQISKIQGIPVALPANPGTQQQMVMFNGSQITFGAIPSGGSGVSNLFGDVTGSPTSNTVVRIQNRAVSSTAPSQGQVLGWNGSAWAPTSLPQTGSTISSVPATVQSSHQVYREWLIFKVGQNSIAFLCSDFKNGDLIFPPANWNTGAGGGWGYSMISPCLSYLPAVETLGSVQVTAAIAGNAIQVAVNAFKPDGSQATATQAGAFVSVMVVLIGKDSN